MKSLVHTGELCSRRVPLEHAPGAESLVCIGLNNLWADGVGLLKGRYTRGILLPEHAPGAHSGSKAPPCVPTISWVYFILGSRISTPQNVPHIWEQAPGAN